MQNVKGSNTYGSIVWQGCLEVGSIVSVGAGAPEDAGGLGEDAWSIKALSDTQARQQELVAHYTAARTPQQSEVWAALGRALVSQRKGPSARHIYISSSMLLVETCAS